MYTLGSGKPDQVLKLQSRALGQNSTLLPAAQKLEASNSLSCFSHVENQNHYQFLLLSLTILGPGLVSIYFRILK